MKKILATIISFVLMISLISCGKTNSAEVSSTTSEVSSKESENLKIVDSAGVEVEIPKEVNKIADSWKAHNEVLTVLGAGDKVVATVLSKKSMPWLYKVNPNMEKAVTTFGTSFNAEELMNNKPNVVFMSSGDANASKISSLGIPVVQLKFTTFDTMKECITLTAKVLGKSAMDKAENYNTYLDSKLKAIKDVTSKIPDSQKPKVLHVESLSPIGVDGSDTIINEWIEAAGGINAAGSISGNQKEVSMEQILEWNPDIIIFGANGASGEVTAMEQLVKDPQWQQVNAVKNNKVYQNPTGAFLWDRYSCEEALQIQWAAKTINPDKFKDLDINAETKNFYKTFLNYELTDEDVQKILKAQPPEK